MVLKLAPHNNKKCNIKFVLVMTDFTKVCASSRRIIGNYFSRTWIPSIKCNYWDDVAGALVRNHIGSDTKFVPLILNCFCKGIRVLQGHNCLLANHLYFENNSLKRSYSLLKWITTSLYDRNMFEQQTIKLENG